MTNGVTKLDTSTRLAYARTFLAHERTLMAWVRTSSSLITFGFSIYKFFQLERGAGNEFPTTQVVGPRQFSMILIIIGVVSLRAGDDPAPASTEDPQDRIPKYPDVDGRDSCRSGFRSRSRGHSRGYLPFVSDTGRVSRHECRVKNKGHESKR